MLFRSGEEDRDVRELETGADAATETEDHIARIRLRLVAGGLHEPVRVEREGIGVHLGVVQHVPDVRDDDRALGEVVAGMDVVLDQTVRDGCAYTPLAAGISRATSHTYQEAQRCSNGGSRGTQR